MSLTTTEIKSIADKHLDAWHATFSEGPPVGGRTLSDYVADGIAEALAKQEKMYADGAATRVHEDTKRIDWLESGGHAFGTKWVGSAHARMVGHATGHEAATVRQAIDAAIRQQETPAT